MDAAEQVEHEQAHEQRRGRRIARRDLPREQPVDRDRADRDADREGRQEQGRDGLVGAERILDQRRELRGEHRAHRPEEADRDDRQEQARDVQRRADQADRGAEMCQSIWSGGASGSGGAGGTKWPAMRPITATSSTAERRPFGVEAAVRILDHQHAAEQGAAEDADVGSGLDQPGAAKHFVARRDAAAGWHI